MKEEVNKSLFPKSIVYFSDDVAILPGDGQALPIGDARANWQVLVDGTSKEGFRPLYLHRAELNDPQTRLKIEDFITQQRQMKNKIIQSRVRSASYVIRHAQDAFSMFSYLCGEHFHIALNARDKLEAYLTDHYTKRHEKMTTENILASAKKVTQQIPGLSALVKHEVFTAINNLYTSKYSKPLIDYFAHRNDFVILVFPEQTVYPHLLGIRRSGEADANLNRILVAGTSKYDFYETFKVPPFFVTKNNTIAGPHIYGGHGFYDIDQQDDRFNFILTYSNHPMSDHSLRKIESLIIEELSDLASVLISGKGSSENNIPLAIQRPPNAGWLLTEVQKETLTEKFNCILRRLNETEKLVQKVKNHQTLNAIETLHYEAIKQKIAHYEKNKEFYPRHIIAHVPSPLCQKFFNTTPGDKIPTPANSSWAGEMLEVVVAEKRYYPPNPEFVILHLKAPAISRDHELYAYLLEDLIFQIRKAIQLDPSYHKHEHWMPMETLGRLRGVLIHYPLAEEWLSDILPFLEVIDKNFPLQMSPFVPFYASDALPICPATEPQEAPLELPGHTLTFISHPDFEITNTTSSALVVPTDSDKETPLEFSFAYEAIMHGTLSGISNVFENALRLKPVSKKTAHYSKQFLYYSTVFAWHFFSYSEHQQETTIPFSNSTPQGNEMVFFDTQSGHTEYPMNAFLYAAWNTGGIAIANWSFEQVGQHINELGEALKENHWVRCGEMVKHCSSLPRFGVFASHAYQKDAEQALASVVLGTIAQTAVGALGNTLLPKPR